MTTFAFSTEPVLDPVFTAMGLGRRRRAVDVEAGRLRVRMGWGFRLDVPVSWVRGSAPDLRPVFGWGVHGVGSRWLVNASSSGLVSLRLDPPGRGRVMGVPVRVRELTVAVEDPGAFMAALASPQDDVSDGPQDSREFEPARPANDEGSGTSRGGGTYPTLFSAARAPNAGRVRRGGATAPHAPALEVRPTSGSSSSSCRSSCRSCRSCTS
ncbi:MAG: hypothetical protein U0Q15_04845 [Kineosporiaceae bacterium]